MASDASRTGRSQYRANSVALAFLSAAMLLLEGCESRVHELELDPATMKQVAKVSDRFLSYNVEMVEVTGGRFWRPYQDGKREGDDRYEYRPPMDFTDPRLIKLSAELGPAFAKSISFNIIYIIRTLNTPVSIYGSLCGISLFPTMLRYSSPKAPTQVRFSL